MVMLSAAYFGSQTGREEPIGSSRRLDFVFWQVIDDGEKIVALFHRLLCAHWFIQKRVEIFWAPVTQG
jgi:hypothetical protein